MENIIWLFGGFLIARLFSYLKAFAQSYLLIKQTEFDCLRVLGATSESIAFVREAKQRLISDSELPNEVKNQLKVQLNIEEHLVSVWRKTSIDNFVASYPARYRNALDFHDWDSAMIHLTT